MQRHPFSHISCLPIRFNREDPLAVVVVKVSVLVYGCIRVMALWRLSS